MIRVVIETTELNLIGIILDELGKPLPGASVQVKGYKFIGWLLILMASFEIDFAIISIYYMFLYCY